MTDRPVTTQPACGNPRPHSPHNGMASNGEPWCHGVPDPAKPQPGDWVQVWGQVTDQPTHPEDVPVEFYSHNANYSCDVRRDRVTLSMTTPDFVSRCSHLMGTELELLMRCTLHEAHGGPHKGGDGDRTMWTSGSSVGYIEEK